MPPIERVQSDPTAWWWFYGVTAAQITQTLTQNNARIVDLQVESLPASGGIFSVAMVANTGPYFQRVVVVLRSVRTGAQPEALSVERPPDQHQSLSGSQRRPRLRRSYGLQYRSGRQGMVVVLRPCSLRRSLTQAAQRPRRRS